MTCCLPVEPKIKPFVEPVISNARTLLGCCDKCLLDGLGLRLRAQQPYSHSATLKVGYLQQSKAIRPRHSYLASGPRMAEYTHAMTARVPVCVGQLHTKGRRSPHCVPQPKTLFSTPAHIHTIDIHRSPTFFDKGVLLSLSCLYELKVTLPALKSSLTPSATGSRRGAKSPVVVSVSRPPERPCLPSPEPAGDRRGAVSVSQTVGRRETDGRRRQNGRHF